MYVNGQYDASDELGRRRYFALRDQDSVTFCRSRGRSYGVAPSSRSGLGLVQGFPIGEPLPAESSSPDPKFANDQASSHYTSSLFDFGAYSVDNPEGVLVFTHGALLGQFWSAFDDWKQDVTGRLRFTAQERGTVDADPSKYLHVTWSVNTVSTDPYPRLTTRAQPAPVEDGLQNPDREFTIMQAINGPSMRLDLEAFHGLVNGNRGGEQQADAHALIDYESENSGLSSSGTFA